MNVFHYGLAGGLLGKVLSKVTLNVTKKNLIMKMLFRTFFPLRRSRTVGVTVVKSLGVKSFFKRSVSGTPVLVFLFVT